MNSLHESIKDCTICKEFLPTQPRPVLQFHHLSKIAIIGQAPGRVVNETGIPWDDKSGERLREWLAISNEDFYNPEKIALIPMGFCYPGTGKSGDLPPRKECAQKWHKAVLDTCQSLELTILIGNYAQAYYLGREREKNLTQTVRVYKRYLPNFLVLPHPSPRNNIWLKKNPWFAQELIPQLQHLTGNLLKT